MRLATIAVVLLTLAASAQEAANQVELRAGPVQAGYVAGRNLNLRYRGADAFLAIPEEFVVHSQDWKTISFASGRKPAPATVNGQSYTVEESGAGFSYTKTISLVGEDTVRVVYDYGQTGSKDAYLDLGWRPAVPWLDGAQFAIKVGDKLDQGRMTYGRGEPRARWTSRDYAFGSVFGTWHLTSTRPFTLYDDRDKGAFFLGWALRLDDGQRYHDVVEIRFDPTPQTLDGVTAGALDWSREADTGYVRVGLDLGRLPDGPASVKVRLTTSLGDQPAGAAEATVPLAAAAKHAELRLPLPNPGEYQLSLAVTDLAGQPILHVDHLPAKAARVARLYAGQSLYTSEKQGEWVLTLAPGADRRALSAEIRGDGVGQRTLQFAADETVLPFDLSALADGPHQATVTLRNGTQVVSTVTASFVKAPPKAHEVKIDHRSRGLVVDGKPFFPFGFYTIMGQWDDDKDRTGILRLEAPYKFDMICCYLDVKNEVRAPRRPKWQAWADAVDTVGLKMHYDLRSITDLPASPEVSALLADEVAAYRDLPSLLCYYLADEPDGSGRSPDRYVAHRQAIAKLDPYHPTTMVFCVPPKAADYAAGMDIMMVDPYPIPTSPVTNVSDTVDLVGGAVDWSMPIWCVPQAFGGQEWWGREPTWQEQRCMTWLAIAHGATGIQYFIRIPPHEHPVGDAMWAECRKLAAEVKELTPVLLSHEPAAAATSLQPAPWLHLSTRQYDGVAYVIAVNSDKQPHALALTCAAKPIEPTAQVLFDDREVPVAADGTVRDLIDSFGVRLYAYRTAPARPNRVVLAEGNRIRNGGFEQATAAGIPDAFHLSGSPDEGASWGTDPQEAVEGRHSLYVRRPRDGTPWDNVCPGIDSFPMELGEGRYRLSFWVKSDRDDGGANFGLYGYDKSPWKDITASREWHQETLDFEVPKDTHWTSWRISATRRETLWVDALEVRPLP